MRNRVAAVFVLATVTVGLLGLGAWALDRFTTRVPDLARMSPEKARAALRSSGLLVDRVSVLGGGAHPGLAVEVVHAQSPTAGTMVLRGSRVDLIDIRPFRAQLPNVVGMYSTDAVKTLGAAGFYATLAPGSELTSGGVRSIVATQDEPAGTDAVTGSQVRLSTVMFHGRDARRDILPAHGPFFLRYGIRGAYCMGCHSVGACAEPGCHDRSKSFAALVGS